MALAKQLSGDVAEVDVDGAPSRAFAFRVAPDRAENLAESQRGKKTPRTPSSGDLLITARCLGNEMTRCVERQQGWLGGSFAQSRARFHFSIGACDSSYLVSDTAKIRNPVRGRALVFTNTWETTQVYIRAAFSGETPLAHCVQCVFVFSRHRVRRWRRRKVHADRARKSLWMRAVWSCRKLSDKRR